MTLPSQIFFKPTPKFLKWIKTYAGKRTVIDCGAGQGWLSKQLNENGMQVIALDSNTREETFFPVVYKECEYFDFPRQSLPIIARPCHSHWVWDTINRALHGFGSQRCKAVLYIGKEENLKGDLDLKDPSYVITKLLDKAGKDKEGVWEISLKSQDPLETWCLVKTPFWDAPEWVEDIGEDWGNLNGGHCPKSKKDKVLEICQVQSYKDLDWSKTSLWQKKW